jgi:hypothetical protein
MLCVLLLQKQVVVLEDMGGGSNNSSSNSSNSSNAISSSVADTDAAAAALQSVMDSVHVHIGLPPDNVEDKVCAAISVISAIACIAVVVDATN